MNKYLTIFFLYALSIVSLTSTGMAVWQSFKANDLKAQLADKINSNSKLVAEISNLHDTIANMKKPKAAPEKCAIGIKNNNPLNIKAMKHDKWRGQIGTDEFNHAVFSLPEYGIRAAANVLINYYSEHKLDTIDGIVERFCTGNKAEYKAFLSRRLGLKENERFNVMGRMHHLLQHMARFETGKDWPVSMFIPYSITNVAYQKGQNK